MQTFLMKNLASFILAGHKNKNVQISSIVISQTIKKLEAVFTGGENTGAEACLWLGMGKLRVNIGMNI